MAAWVHAFQLEETIVETTCSIGTEEALVSLGFSTKKVNLLKSSFICGFILSLP